MERDVVPGAGNGLGVCPGAEETGAERVPRAEETRVGKKEVP